MICIGNAEFRTGKSKIYLGNAGTNLPVGTHADAVHKLEWYALRWKIETFFRTLKTGCRIEELRLATADRLANCIALCCVVAWRVSWLASGRGNATTPACVTEDAGWGRKYLNRWHNWTINIIEAGA